MKQNDTECLPVGSTVVLVCESSGNPEPVVQIRNSDGKIVGSGPASANYSLRTNSQNKETYHCFAVTKFDSVAKNITICSGKTALQSS